jgi:hypothetical protein
MNLSMQMVRGLGALAMCAAVSAFALTQPAPVRDDQEATVAHSRLEIVTVNGADNAPRFQVASVRIGKPVPLTVDQVRMAMHARASDTHG